MKIQTSRFGAVEFAEDDILDFPEGLLGFDHMRQFVLLDDPHDEIFIWLQSCENPAIAFPVLEPELFAEGYSIHLGKRDLESLDINSLDDCRYFTVVTIPEDPTKMTANLKAPIIINGANRKARQIVLQDNNLAIREPIFSKLQQRVVQSPSHPIKSQALDWGVAVALPSEDIGSGTGSEPGATA
ncbi:MAG: flagellar assembly protein FliW [Pseudobdellovibrionaceae bacterium]|nr:flagellar assembly protein FliW [Bdellovibrionales bacterium]USN46471.1 MAG: flagellar assembly protein FliW [Pseudobdellovibrionaceae bacterium]